MCAKVAARWEVGEAAGVAAALLGDETPRVRVAALRVPAVVGELSVRSAARRAQVALRRQLDLEP